MDHEFELTFSLFLKQRSREGLVLVGMRVEEKQRKGVDGREARLLLSDREGNKFVLRTFADSSPRSDFFEWELLPYSDFRAKNPMTEGPRAEAAGEKDAIVRTTHGTIFYMASAKEILFREAWGRFSCRYCATVPEFLISYGAAWASPRNYFEVPAEFREAVGEAALRRHIAPEMHGRFLTDLNALAGIPEWPGPGRSSPREPYLDERRRRIREVLDMFGLECSVDDIHSVEQHFNSLNRRK